MGGAASGAAEAASDARASLQSDGAVLIRGVLTDGDQVVNIVVKTMIMAISKLTSCKHS